jgi:hypothetical protein
MSVFTSRQPLILRLPEERAKKVKEHIDKGAFKIEAEVNTEHNLREISSFQPHDARKNFFRFRLNPLPSYLSSTGNESESRAGGMSRSSSSSSVASEPIDLPALLANLPTKVEAHRVYEGSNAYKAADIGK